MPSLKFMVTYTLVDGTGVRRFYTDIVEMPRLPNIETMAEHAYLYLLNETKSHAALLAVYYAGAFKPNYLYLDADVREWKGIARGD